jgi:hypothetical protein
MKYSKIKTLAITVSLILSSTVLFASVAEASDKEVEVERSSVNINETVLSRCGDHMVAFSGVATYGEGSQELIISLDGVVVFSTFDKPINWSLLIPVTTGAHALTAEVREPGSRNIIQDTFAFNVATCPETNGGGEGDEQDCETSTNPDACGEGYTNEKPAPVGKVKGVTAPAAEQKLEVFPSAGPNPLLPLMLVGSWFTVAGVGFKKKW